MWHGGAVDHSRPLLNVATECDVPPLHPEKIKTAVVIALQGSKVCPLINIAGEGFVPYFFSSVFFFFFVSISEIFKFQEKNAPRKKGRKKKLLRPLFSPKVVLHACQVPLSVFSSR